MNPSSQNDCMMDSERGHSLTSNPRYWKFMYSHLTRSDDSLNPRRHFIPSMETNMDFKQYRPGLDDDTIDRIMDDHIAVMIIQSLNWTSLSKEEMDKIIPGNDHSLGLLLDSHVVVSEGHLYSLDVTIQSFGFRPNNIDDIRYALGMSARMWIRDLGYLSAYIADSLVSLFFGIEPCWEGEAEDLAHRAGLVDMNGNITPKGRERAFSIYSQVADVFDVRSVDPVTLYGKWSAPTVD